MTARQCASAILASFGVHLPLSSFPFASAAFTLKLPSPGLYDRASNMRKSTQLSTITNHFVVPAYQPHKVCAVI